VIIGDLYKELWASLQFWQIGCTGETRSKSRSTRSSKIIVLEYKDQRKRIFGKLCYEKWVGKEEAAQAGAMDQRGKVPEGES
jgi:hypothetical protein